MLVLSRKTNETILIGDGITITVCRIGETVVQLGIDAPGLPVRRGELPPRSPLDKGEP